VDDEPFVLSAVSGILEHAGYEVLRARSAQEALIIAVRHSEPIHLLLCDVIMPGENGPSMADRFASLHPETPSLFMAGWPDGPEVVERILARGIPFLPKPFIPETLVSKVREVLSGRAGRAVAAC
jgi:DNA-binding NtrC family response regulator